VGATHKKIKGDNRMKAFFSERIGTIFFLSAVLALIFPAFGMGQDRNEGISTLSAPIDSLYKGFLKRHPALMSISWRYE
jgi:hypothetical protein